MATIFYLENVAWEFKTVHTQVGTKEECQNLSYNKGGAEGSFYVQNNLLTFSQLCDFDIYACGQPMVRLFA